MSPIFSRNKYAYSGWIIISIISILIIGTILAGLLFKNEEKIKLAFKNNQTISFFVASYNKEKKISGAFVILLQTKTNRCSVISILPKTYINFGEAGYFTLEEVFLKKIPIENIINGVSTLLNCKINYYVFFEKNNLIRFIDMVGGIEIFSEEIKHPDLKVHIPNGITVLDGDKAIEYLSFIAGNDTENEYDQLKRIQNIVKGLLKLKADFLEEYNENVILKYFFTSFSTNMSVNEFLILYKEIRQKYLNGIKDYSIGLQNIIIYCDKKIIPKYDYIYLPKKSGEWIKLEVTEIFKNLEKEYNEKEMGNIVIEILNGTDIIGLASRAQNYITSYGIDVLNVANADRNDYENTVIIIRSSEQKARKIAELVHCKRVIVANDELENKKIDVTLVLGRDFDGRIVR